MLPLLLASSLLLLAGAAQNGRIVDVQSSSGVDFETESGDPEKRTILSSLGGGAGLFDYDADGDLDLYLPGHRRSALYRNEGGFHFVDVTASAGVGDDGWNIGCASGDIDNDGFPDLYVTAIGAGHLYRNRGDGTFEDATSRLGEGGLGFGSSAAFFDADGDGALDLYVARYVDPEQTFPEPGSEPTCLWLGMAVMCGPRGLAGDGDLFYRNEHGRFREATRESGLEDRGVAFGLGVVSADYDGDGDADLYVANDTDPNFLYQNDGKGHFEDVGLLSGVAYNGSGAPEAGMGVDFGDPNGDGWLDLFVTNFSHETNTLYLGSESGLFADATEEAGLSASSLGKLGWGTHFVDLDSDGDEDLFVANGHVYPRVEEADATTSFRESDQIYWNDGRGNFTEGHEPVDSSDGPRASRGAAFGDIDEDGDPDVVVAAIDERPSLLRNDRVPQARWLGIRLVGRTSNRDGSGARVRWSSGGRRQIKLAHRSGSIFSSSDPRVLFGLGDSDGGGELEILWPSGQTSRLEATETNRYVVVIEGVEGSTSP